VDRGLIDPPIILMKSRRLIQLPLDDPQDLAKRVMKFAKLITLSTIGVIVLGASGSRAAPIIAGVIGGGAYGNFLITKTRAIPHCGVDPRHHRHCQPLREPASKT
jgi:hypothetical protein